MYGHWIDQNKISHSVKCNNKYAAKALYDKLNGHIVKSMWRYELPFWKISKKILMAA